MQLTSIWWTRTDTSTQGLRKTIILRPLTMSKSVRRTCMYNVKQRVQCAHETVLWTRFSFVVTKLRKGDIFANYKTVSTIPYISSDLKLSENLQTIISRRATFLFDQKRFMGLEIRYMSHIPLTEWRHRPKPEFFCTLNLTITLTNPNVTLTLT